MNAYRIHTVSVAREALEEGRVEGGEGAALGGREQAAPRVVAQHHPGLGRKGVLSEGGRRNSGYDIFL